MTQYSIDASINDQPAQVVKRNIHSPAIENNIIFVDDFGVRVPDDVNVADGITLVLKIKPAL